MKIKLNQRFSAPDGSEWTFVGKVDQSDRYVFRNEDKPDYEWQEKRPLYIYNKNETKEVFNISEIII